MGDFIPPSLFIFFYFDIDSIVVSVLKDGVIDTHLKKNGYGFGDEARYGDRLRHRVGLGIHPAGQGQPQGAGADQRGGVGQRRFDSGPDRFGYRAVAVAQFAGDAGEVHVQIRLVQPARPRPAVNEVREARFRMHGDGVSIARAAGPLPVPWPSV